MVNVSPREVPRPTTQGDVPTLTPPRRHFLIHQSYPGLNQLYPGIHMGSVQGRSEVVLHHDRLTWR